MGECAEKIATAVVVGLAVAMWVAFIAGEWGGF